MSTDAALHAYIAAMELDVAKRVVDRLLEAGYAVTVFDGEEETLVHSRDGEAILAAMLTTDEDYLLARPADEPQARPAFVRFIYGNDGWDVVNDYSMSLEPAMSPINAYCEALADGKVLADLGPTNARSATIVAEPGNRPSLER